MEGLARIKQLASALSVPFAENEPMSEHTSFAIGGPADLFLTPASPETVPALLSACRTEEIPLFILGNGTNLLVSDRGIAGVVLQTAGAFPDITPVSAFEIDCGAGVKLSRICMYALEHSLSGLEFAWGIPGTAGGAAFMNAGAYGGEMKDVTVSCSHLDRKGETGALEGDALLFAYRKSAYAGNECLLTGVRLRLKPGGTEAIRARMDDVMNRRKEKQPLDMPSAGSVFKRPSVCFAGTLIEECGLKGLSVGGAAVSEKHAGFIVNTGGATCTDVLILIEKIQKEVFLQTSVKLECEIRTVGK